MATFADIFNRLAPQQTQATGGFPSLEQWLQQKGYTQADTELYDSETGTSQRRLFNNPAFDYYGSKYGVQPERSGPLGFSLSSPVRQLGSYEELLQMIQPGNALRGNIPELPYLSLSPERQMDIIKQALAGSGGTRSGFDRSFDSVLTPEELSVITAHRNYMPEDDFFGKYGPALGSLAFGGLIGATGGFGGAGLDAYTGATGAGAFGGDIAGTAFAGEGLTGAGLTGGNVGFFDDILGEFASDQGFLPGSFDLGESLYGGTATQGLDMAAAESWLRNLVGGGVSGVGNNLISSGLRSLFGGSTGAGGGGLLNFLGGGLGSAINTAPILAAINYARNQSPFDTSRLESLYSGFDPQASAFQYDTNTGLGREELTSGLARRGISGSSFGDQSLTNYNTFRDLGRQSLINQGVGQQAGIAGQILSSDVASRQMKNDLYGRALLALSGGLSPTNTSAFFGR